MVSFSLLDFICIVILIIRIKPLENTRVCVAACTQHATHHTEAAPEPATQSAFPTAAFANLSIAPTPALGPASVC